MKILCKEKDFYDYVGYASEYGMEDITFDRRNMLMIKPGTISWDITSCGSIVDSILKGPVDDIGLWLGFDLYIFRIREVSDRRISSPTGSYLSEKFKWKAELVCHRKFYDVKHEYPIEFVKIDNGISDVDYWKSHRWKMWSSNYEAKYNDFSLRDNEYKNGNPNNWKMKPFEIDSSKKGAIPILRNTWVPSFVDANEAYYNIEEWLIAQHNDVDQESKGITDIDKVINHGFDKRESFRNIK